MGYGIEVLMTGLATLPKCNQEASVVKDKVGSVKDKIQ